MMPGRLAQISSHTAFGKRNEGLVTFLVYPPDDLVLVVQIQWIGD